ncbi:MAG: hypothetical protein NXI32_01325 [bacterium]|nr:hypothetical protein [bacterium]
MLLVGRASVWDWLSYPAVRAVLAVLVVLVVVFGGIQLLIRLRAATIKPDTNHDDLAKNFEEMRLEGDIDEAELRKIKAVLGKSQDSLAEE